MAAFKELGPRDHPQPGDLNPQAEGEMVGGGTQRDLGINPDEILAKMVAHTLGKDRLRANTYTGVVIRSNMQVTAISPELGPYFKVYKEIEEKYIKTTKIIKPKFITNRNNEKEIHYVTLP